MVNRSRLKQLKICKDAEIGVEILHISPNTSSTKNSLAVHY